MRYVRAGFVVVAAASSITLASCSSAPTGSTPGHRPTTHPGAPASTHPSVAAGAAHGVPALRSRVAPTRLPQPVARPVVLRDARDLTVLGGLDAVDQSTSRVLRIDPATGTVLAHGTLARATHDAGGAVLRGADVVFGGGTATSTATVQAWTPSSGGRVVGHLPAPRSDSSAVAIGATGYLVGGYTGTRWLPDVLATRDGSRFRVVARLPVPVRYAAVTAVGGRIVVAGGVRGNGTSVRLIQAVDPTTGRATVLGRLPRPVAYAAALTLDGHVYIAGGRTEGGVTATIWGMDPTTGTVTAAGDLPMPVADAGAATIGASGYLVGGTGARILRTVVVLRSRTSGTSVGGPKRPSPRTGRNRSVRHRRSSWRQRVRHCRKPCTTPASAITGSKLTSTKPAS